MREDRLVQKFIDNLPHLQFTKIESAITVGFPDTYVSKKFYSGIPIEFKIAKGRYVYFQRSQIVWWRKNMSPALVIVALNDIDLIFITEDQMDQMIISNCFEPYQHKMRLDLNTEQALYDHLPRGTSWQDIESYIFRIPK